MRHIDNTHLPRLIDVTRVENAKQTCEGLNAEERSQYIDDNGACWSYLKPALWQLGQMKCWYSEKIINVHEGHVEHFRPKKRLHGDRHGGYWWDAFDWKNFRLSHSTSNIRLKDYLTREPAGKGSYFPLRTNGNRATNKVSENNEDPVLLDPTNSADCKLLCFDSSNGKPIPLHKEADDEWKYQRVIKSINFYHLDEGTWNYERKDLMDEVSVLCDRIIENFLNEQAVDTMIGELKAYLEPHAEFISAVEQVIKEKGLLESIH